MIKITVEKTITELPVDSTDDEILENIFSNFERFINSARWTITRVPEKNLIV